jgi:hypothetical protein
MNPELQKAIEDLRGKPVHVRPSLYAMYFEGLKQIAIEHGYNLCIHGSMNRDFDLVAFPWADEIKPHFDMVDQMRDFVGGKFNAGDNKGGLVGQRLHGRINYTINVWRKTPFTPEEDKQYYLDISVFPPKLPDIICDNCKKGDHSNCNDMTCICRVSTHEAFRSTNNNAGLQPVQEWIRVEDGLPEKRIRALGWDGFIVWEFYVDFDGLLKYSHVDNQLHDASKITHWQPLPSPPQSNQP